jgi:hypothetical protein
MNIQSSNMNFDYVLNVNIIFNKYNESINMKLRIKIHWLHFIGAHKMSKAYHIKDKDLIEIYH